MKELANQIQQAMRVANAATAKNDTIQLPLKRDEAMALVFMLAEANRDAPGEVSRRSRNGKLLTSCRAVADLDAQRRTWLADRIIRIASAKWPELEPALFEISE